MTYNSKPITAGLINFQLNGGGEVFGGAIKADGTYAFDLPPGEYRVRIDAPGEYPPWKDGDPPPKEPERQAPMKYAGYESSGLTATIGDEGSKELDFPLQ